MGSLRRRRVKRTPHPSNCFKRISAGELLTDVEKHTAAVIIAIKCFRDILRDMCGYLVFYSCTQPHAFVSTNGFGNFDVPSGCQINFGAKLAFEILSLSFPSRSCHLLTTGEDHQVIIPGRTNVSDSKAISRENISRSAWLILILFDVRQTRFVKF